MCAHNLIAVFTKQKIAHLRTCFDCIDFLILQSVPETDAPICCASTTNQQTMLMWWPSQGFDSSKMTMVFSNRFWLIL